MKDGMQKMDWSGVRAMVFDMDGTLVNTEHVIVQAASETLVHFGGAPLPANYRMPNMFGTAADLIADVFKERGLPLPAEGRTQTGLVFEDFYAQQPSSEAPLYEGVKDWLLAAKARGIALGVCTNKQRALALIGLQAVGVLDLFEVVVGRDCAGVPKPAPEPLYHTLSQMKVAAQDAVFFGDTHADAGCAQAAGVRFAWFTSGFGTDRVRDFPRALSFADYHALSFVPG